MPNSINRCYCSEGTEAERDSCNSSTQAHCELVVKQAGHEDRPRGGQTSAPESPPGPPPAIWLPSGAAPVQFEPIFNVSQRKGRRKQKDHLLPLIEKQDRKADKPRKIGTTPRTSADAREQGDERGRKDRSTLLLLPGDSSAGCCPLHPVLGYKNALQGGQRHSNEVASIYPEGAKPTSFSLSFTM